MTVEKRIFQFLVGIFFVLSACADTTPAEPALLAVVRKNYNPGRPFSAKFSVAIYWNIREKEEKKKGRILVAPGDKFRVTINKETFVSNGETFWHYSAGTKQLVVKRLVDVDRSALPSQIFARYIGVYRFREAERKKHIAVFSGTSDSAGAPYTEVRLWVREADGGIIRCVLTDRKLNTFTYEFSDMAVGKNIPQRTFEFDIPKNARIVDMRK